MSLAQARRLARQALVDVVMGGDPAGRHANVEELGREIKSTFSARAQRPARKGRKKRRVAIETAAKAEERGIDVRQWSIPELINYIVEEGTATVRVQYVHDDWLDIDDVLDLSDLYKF